MKRELPDLKTLRKTRLNLLRTNAGWYDLNILKINRWISSKLTYIRSLYIPPLLVREALIISIYCSVQFVPFLVLSPSDRRLRRLASSCYIYAFSFTLLLRDPTTEESLMMILSYCKTFFFLLWRMLIESIAISQSIGCSFQSSVTRINKLSKSLTLNSFYTSCKMLQKHKRPKSNYNIIFFLTDCQLEFRLWK